MSSSQPSSVPARPRAGLVELPPLQLRILTNGAQVGIQGATYLAGKLGVDFSKLGGNGRETFRWEPTSKVYACNQPWSKEHVHGLLKAAVEQHMPGRNVAVVYG